MDEGDFDLHTTIAAVLVLSGNFDAYDVVLLHAQAVLDRKSNKETGPSDEDVVKGLGNFVKPLTDA